MLFILCAAFSILAFLAAVAFFAVSLSGYTEVTTAEVGPVRVESNISASGNSEGNGSLVKGVYSNGYEDRELMLGDLNGPTSKLLLIIIYPNQEN